MSDIPKGYKQTEVGVIPDDWEVKPIGTFTSISVGKDLNDKNFSINRDDYYKYPVYSNTVSNYGLYGYYDNAEYNGNSLTIVGRGAGLGTAFSRSGSYNAIGRLIVLLPEEKINAVYLTEYINHRVNIFLESGGIPQLTGLSIAKYLVAIPILAEQTAIATALSDTDALISGLEKLIAKKRNIKQGAMQELLKPKEGWEMKKLGEIAEVVGGGTPSTFVSKFWNGTINWFTPTEIGRCKYTYESVRKITSEGFSDSSAKILPIGTILLTSRAGIGDVSILMSEGCTNQGFQSLIPKNDFSNEYIYYLLITLKSVLLQNASGSTFLEISPNKLKQIEVLMPPKEEQIRIATILSDMDAEISALESKLDKYRQIKLGMMQELLTGKVRLV